jgi:hypothetical protein
MGEEYGEPHPFLYFVSHQSPALVQAVREGRRAEFRSFAWQGEIPDPAAEETFRRSKLDRTAAHAPEHEAPWGWRLRLSTDEPAYGGAGTTTAIVPAAATEPVLDAPKRLLTAALPVEARARTVRLAPRSAAVYVRDFEDGGVVP